MDRRWVGVAMVMSVILAAVVVPQFGGVKLWGVAVAAPPPKPPTAGECLIAPIQSRTTGFLDTGQATGNYPSLPLSACATSRYGEVAAVIQASPEALPSQLPSAEQGARPTGQVAPSTGQGAPSTGQGAPSTGQGEFSNGFVADRCAALDASYLGLASASGSVADSSPTSSAGPTSMIWAPTTNYTSVVAGPTDLQTAFGQRWLACVVIVGDLAGGTTKLTGPLRDAAVTGQNRDQLGDCVLGIDLTAGGIPLACLVPHEGELFGGGPALKPVPWNFAELTETCTEFVKRATGLPDPTVGGQLRVEIQGSYAGNPLCGLESVTGRELKGSLLGIGDRPMPWA